MATGFIDMRMMMMLLPLGHHYPLGHVNPKYSTPHVFATHSRLTRTAAAYSYTNKTHEGEDDAGTEVRGVGAGPALYVVVGR